MIYDLIVVGGGISGLYLLHRIHQEFPNWKVLLLEKENIFGGRVYTYHDVYMDVEAGAGRFNESHFLLIGLIRELGLARQMRKHSSSVGYIFADGSGILHNSVFDTPKQASGLWEPLFLQIVEARLGKTLPNAGLIAKIVLASQLESRETLQKQTFGEYALHIVGKKNFDFIKDSFGYYSELVIMNAYDALKLMQNLGPQNQFYGLHGGLSQIIDRMISRFPSNLRLMKKKTVVGIHENDAVFSVVCKENQIPFYGKRCVFAVTKNVLQSIAFFRPLRKVLDQINCGTLCRIYSKFNVKKKEHLWLRSLTKFTTNNALRMVIPINPEKGYIMISYTDNFYADFWHQLYEKKGEMGVNLELQRLMKQVLGILIPMPIETRVFYWNCGVGYWGKGADSKIISERMICPFPDKKIYVCGENFSENNQQWMEGGLDTAVNVLERMKQNGE